MTTTTVDTAASPGLAGLSEQLNRALTRALWNRVLLTAAIALAAALVAYGTLRAADTLLELDLSGGSILLLAAAAGLVGAGIAAAALLARRPTLAEIARRADSRFALNERVSTALQLSTSRHGFDGAVGRALLQDAERRSDAVDPSALVRVQFGRIAIVLLAALAFATVALALQPGLSEGEESAAVNAPPAELTAAEQADTAEDLRRIGDALATDAEARDDAFLEAIAREVQQLGAQLEAGEIPDREILLAELDRLTEFAADAYERAGDAGAQDDLSRLLDATRQNVARPEQFMPNVGEEALAGPDNAVPENAGPAPEAEGGALDDMLADIEADQAAAAEAREMTPQAGQPGEGVVGDYYELARADAAARAAAAERRAANEQELAGAQLAGPAQNSNRGEGLMAGQGEQPLEGDIIEADPFEMGGELLLEDELDGEGRRIKVDVPPEAESIQLAAGDVVAGDWQRFQETEVARSLYPLSDRDVLARYFRGIAEAQE